MAPPRSGKKQAAKHIAIYSAGSIIRQLAGFIMLPIYTSYLTPADYGVVGLLVVMISLFELVMGARFAQAVPKFYYESDEAAWQNTVVSTALLVTLFISAISTMLVAFFSKSIAQILFGSDGYQIHVAIYCVLLFTSAIEAYGLAFLRLKEKPVLFMTNSIAKLILQLALNILFVVHYELGVMGVIYSALISSCVISLWVAIYIVYHAGIIVDFSLTKRLFRFSWPLWLAGIAGLYVASSNRYFIRIFSDLEQVGLYELATKFAMVLPMLIWNPFSQWWQTERFKIYRSADKGVSVFPVVFEAMVIIMVIAAATISLFSGSLIKAMASPEFHSASRAIPILVFGVLLSNLRFFFFFSFLVTEKTIIITYIKYFSAVLATLLYVGLIPNFKFLGAAVAVLLAEFTVLIVSSTLSKRYFDNQIKLKKSLLVISSVLALLVVEHWVEASLQSPSLIVLTQVAALVIILSICAVMVLTTPELKNALKEVVVYFKQRLKTKKKLI
ncbi:lipopolysaccharide biosynthesis protein [Marinimicrobium sp. ARAG 43.8]|uniref:lipopolysaccharide biosynthesis protein n=1 Tax=Marinimicrobium sp. ARAG 43.8 TaxID=3418719 RepID=UPI003CF67A1A